VATIFNKMEHFVVRLKVLPRLDSYLWIDVSDITAQSRGSAFDQCPISLEHTTEYWILWQSALTAAMLQCTCLRWEGKESASWLDIETTERVGSLSEVNGSYQKTQARVYVLLLEHLRDVSATPFSLHVEVSRVWRKRSGWKNSLVRHTWANLLDLLSTIH
jgi:hypothetical protein